MTTKKEKPIIFSTPMVKAILAGNKTMTRRIIKPQPILAADGMWTWRDCQWMNGGIGFPASGIADYAPYLPGVILWVRETWRGSCVGNAGAQDSVFIEYKACGTEVFDVSPERALYYSGKGRWRSSLFMPRCFPARWIFVT